ncbi:MAG TPA: ABC transporter permease [Bavariicoccus seileri]|uniref:ABC transporter permease n=1 Tax=Bavariicoccus seileri TaxID=549685 RepID=A0A3D4S5W8_9ENTE|nr:ABC transporter permease [Bavariicoccus seileri]HCS93862.1 ABC transporter permease [Bavariicoccus seileri]
MIRNILLSTLLSLKVHKLRVFLTMIGIIIGIAAVVTVSSLGEGMREETLSLINAADANAVKITYQSEDSSNEQMYSSESSDFTFSKADMKRLNRIPGVSSVTADFGDSYGMNSSVQSTYSNGDYFGSFFGTQLAAYQKDAPLEIGRNLLKTDEGNNVIVLSGDIVEALSYEMDVTAADLVGSAVNIDGYMFKVVGVKQPIVYDEFGNSAESADYTWNDMATSDVPQTAFTLLTAAKPINAIQLKVSDDTDRASVVSSAVSQLMENYPDVEGYFEEDTSNQQMIDEFNDYLSSMILFLMAITAISLLVGGIGVMNIMYVSVSERKREIGIRRAIGAKPRDIWLQFMLEAVIITFIGGFIGLSLGYGIAQIVSSVVAIPATLTTQTMLISTSVSVLTGLIFGIIPAINAAKINPIKAIYN